MSENIRTADSKGRVVLPGFANATLIIEKINDSEYRVKKARVIAETDLQFHEEELPRQLTEKDALRFLELLNNPPPPNKASRKAAKEFIKEYGRLEN